MQFAWAILCLAQYAAKNPQTVMGLRFIMGMAESSTFVGMHLIFGSWYTPAEIGKRAALFTSCAQIGSMLVNAKNGLERYKQLIISIACPVLFKLAFTRYIYLTSDNDQTGD